MSRPEGSFEGQSSAGQVLVIEDDADLREALCRVARMQGYRTAGVVSVRDALAKLAERPACVILDLTLIDGTGLAVLENIRGQNLPIDIAVVSGGADLDLLVDAILMRPGAVFTKPVDLTEIAAWLGACRAGHASALANARGRDSDSGLARPE